MGWRHSGFSVHNGARIARDDEKGKEAISQYIIRNTFSLEKFTLLNRCPLDNLTGWTYNEDTNTVIYRSRMTHGKNKRNFQTYTPEEFIAAITQHTCLCVSARRHVPEKSFRNLY